MSTEQSRGARVITNVVGFDDGPFERSRRGARVLLVGAVCARTRLDGVLSGRITKDGRNAAHFEHMVAITNNGPWVLTRP